MERLKPAPPDRSPKKVYRFGPYRIDTRQRLLFREGELVPMSPKVADTLLLLLTRPGELIDKSEFMSTLWPDTFVDEGSLARCVSQLRRALGDDAEDSTYVETVPKRGYRWIAPVDLLPEEQAPAPNRPAAPARSHRGLITAAVSAALLIAAGGGWLWYRSRGIVQQTPVVRPFTAYRGGEYEPAFSPEGTRIAFVWSGESEKEYAIYVRPVDSEALLKLTDGDRAGDGSPAWSPDGSEVAFVRYGPGGVSGLYTVPSLGGSVRRIAPLFNVGEIHDRHLDWSPDGKLFAVADKTSADSPFAIYLISSDGSSRRQLTNPAAHTWGDTGPVFSRDGRYVAFRRTLSSSVNDIYIIPVGGGEPRRLTQDNRFTSAHAWSADGKSIVLSSNRAGRLELWRIPATGGIPERVPGAATGANFLSIAPAGNRLAFSQWSADTNIWKYSLAGDEMPSKPLIASTRADMSPSIAPQADRIAFRSDRSGSNEIWVVDGNGQNARRLTSLGGAMTGSPHWSPDAEWVAFDSRPQGPSHIFVVRSSRSDPKQITTGDADNVVPSWSADGRFIYFSSNRTGSWQVWRVAVDTTGAPTSQPEQITKAGGFAPEQPGDGYCYYAKGPNSAGIWRCPANGGTEEPVVPELAPGLWGHWQAAGSNVYFVTPRASDAAVVRLDLKSGVRHAMRTLPKLPVTEDSGFAVAPDGKWILYAQADQSGSDIFVVEPFQ